MANGKLTDIAAIHLSSSEIVRLNETFLYAPVTPHWKVLRSKKLCHSAPLEMCFLMVSFFARIKIWPKTMDYSPWFDFFGVQKKF